MKAPEKAVWLKKTDVSSIGKTERLFFDFLGQTLTDAGEENLYGDRAAARFAGGCA